MQTLFLTRLTRILQRKQEWRGRGPSASRRLRLIHKAIFSTYCDCVEVGVGARARELIDCARKADYR